MGDLQHEIASEKLVEIAVEIEVYSFTYTDNSHPYLKLNLSLNLIAVPNKLNPNDLDMQLLSTKLLYFTFGQVF